MSFLSSSQRTSARLYKWPGGVQHVKWQSGNPSRVCPSLQSSSCCHGLLVVSSPSSRLPQRAPNFPRQPFRGPHGVRTKHRPRAPPGLALTSLRWFLPLPPHTRLQPQGPPSPSALSSCGRLYPSACLGSGLLPASCLEHTHHRGRDLAAPCSRH